MQTYIVFCTASETSQIIGQLFAVAGYPCFTHYLEYKHLNQGLKIFGVKNAKTSAYRIMVQTAYFNTFWRGLLYSRPMTKEIAIAIAASNSAR